MARKSYNVRRIEPANLAELPSVLDAEQMANVLRISIERVRELTNSGGLRRLAYSRAFLYDAREALRFLEEATDAPPLYPATIKGPS